MLLIDSTCNTAHCCFDYTLVMVKNNLVHFCVPFIKQHIAKGDSLSSSKSMSLGANLLSILYQVIFLLLLTLFI